MAANQNLNGRKMEGKKGEVGLVQWFHINQYEEVKKAISDFKKLGISEIRTNVSWADWNTKGGKEWYDWLFSTLGKELQILPCVLYTPPSGAITSKTSAPLTNPKNFADFIDVLISNYGRYFEYIELWNEPNNKSEYDFTLDEDWNIFCELARSAALCCQKRGKKTVLGGMNPIDPNWLRLMFIKNLMQYFDVVGIHCFRDGSDYSRENWNLEISRIQEVLNAFDSSAKIWITEAGFSTWQHAERRQLKEFINVISSDCDRVYWNGLQDVAAIGPSLRDYQSDERKCHLGMKDSNDVPKLLYTLLTSKGLDRIASYEWMTEPVIGKSKNNNNNDQYTLITGGSGFVGINLANRLLMEGKKVLIFDNLSRAGVKNNLFWLRDKHPVNLQIMIADIRDKAAVAYAVENAERVFHFAAQVAVTSSLENPFHDFEVNAQGTLNLLEAIRNSAHRPPVVFASTNKVYGGLDDLGIVMNGTRYYPENTSFRKHGISEKRNLDFHSPYGCTKGVADQYMLDYARTFGLKTVVFRMSCIYGPHQFGTEDQGWVAHFLIQALKNKPITLYGDGKQVRDILFVEDLVDAYLLTMENIEEISGNAFNMGGGVKNTVSLLELCDLIGEVAGKKPEVMFADWRSSDQKYYVSDFSKFNAVTGWKPQVGVREGLQRLYNWLEENAGMPQTKKESKSKITNPV